MLHYPKIPGSRNAPSGRCLAFEKYDGTNLHWDWDRDFGWHSFGPRREAFNLTSEGIQAFEAKHAHLAGCVPLFQIHFADALEKVFCEHADYRELPAFKAFTEYFGPNSFAGLHRADDSKELRLFDVQSEPRGMLGPQRFLDHFGHLSVARVIYQGKLTGQFAEDVRQGRYGVAEGVICKGGLWGPDVWMVKIKTHAYLERLKLAFADRWEDYWE